MRIVDDELTAADLRAVLTALNRLHAAADPAAFTRALAAELAALIPYDLADWGDLAAGHLDSPRDDFVALLQGPLDGTGDGEERRPASAAPVGHRLAMSAATGSRVLGFVLGRRHAPFGPRDRAVAEVLQTHLGAAFDHARLRGAEQGRRSALPPLTIREQEVLALVADGRTNRDIAHALFIEARTVEKHVENIRGKLGARSRAEAAARWAASLGIPIR